MKSQILSYQKSYLFFPSLPFPSIPFESRFLIVQISLIDKKVAIVPSKIISDSRNLFNFFSNYQNIDSIIILVLHIPIKKC